MNILKSIKDTLIFPIHPSGFPFILICVVSTFILTFLLSSYLFYPSLIITVWCICFFRNPNRYTPDNDKVVISPADGKIISIKEMDPPLELQLPKNNYIKISIFMNVFNVHVNRAPMTGKIINKFYIPGKFLNANLDKASVDNERLGLIMETKIGKTIGFVQIAGLIARRIICDVKEDSFLKAGEEFGIIRFGSRVDIWLPLPINVLVLENQISVAGETILASYKNVKIKK